jgi:hypothetical protein
MIPNLPFHHQVIPDVHRVNHSKLLTEGHLRYYKQNNDQ